MSGTPAILRLADFAAVKVSGEQRRDFLQGQLTQDMQKVTARRGAPAAWCNRQGRVICMMIAVEWSDATFLVMPEAMSAICVQGLGRYILRAKVRIERSELPVFGGVNADELFASATPDEAGAPAPIRPRRRDAPVADDATDSGNAWDCFGGSRYCAVRLPGAGARALMLGCPSDGIGPGADSGWTAEHWRLADIEAEIPWIGQQTTEKFLAHSLNLDLSGAVSFSKGCYVGQEIIARMEHRGTPKRRMRHVQLAPETAVQPGVKLPYPGLGAITIIAAAAGSERLSALAEVRLSQDRAGPPAQPDD